jgi:hypothetical protein
MPKESKVGNNPQDSKVPSRKQPQRQSPKPDTSKTPTPGGEKRTSRPPVDGLVPPDRPRPPKKS